jgi:uncharacterized protein YodC (DUF2158 family)
MTRVTVISGPPLFSRAFDPTSKSVAFERRSPFIEEISMAAFQIGDVVELKSGSPNMTVEDAGEGDTVSCVWFDKSEAKRGYFPASTLKKANTGYTIA